MLRALGLFTVLMLLTNAGCKTTQPGGSKLDALTDASKFEQCRPGIFKIVCKDNRTEYRSKAEVIANEVCMNASMTFNKVTVVASGNDQPNCVVEQSAGEVRLKSAGAGSPFREVEFAQEIEGCKLSKGLVFSDDVTIEIDRKILPADQSYADRNGSVAEASCQESPAVPVIQKASLKTTPGESSTILTVTLEVDSAGPVEYVVYDLYRDDEFLHGVSAGILSTMGGKQTVNFDAEVSKLAASGVYSIRGIYVKAAGGGKSEPWSTPLSQMLKNSEAADPVFQNVVMKSDRNAKGTRLTLDLTVASMAAIRHVFYTLYRDGKSISSWSAGVDSRETEKGVQSVSADVMISKYAPSGTYEIREIVAVASNDKRTVPWPQALTAVIANPEAALPPVIQNVLLNPAVNGDDIVLSLELTAESKAPLSFVGYEIYRDDVFLYSSSSGVIQSTVADSVAKSTVSTIISRFAPGGVYSIRNIEVTAESGLKSRPWNGTLTYVK